MNSLNCYLKLHGCNSTAVYIRTFIVIIQEYFNYGVRDESNSMNIISPIQISTETSVNLSEASKHDLCGSNKQSRKT